MWLAAFQAIRWRYSRIRSSPLRLQAWESINIFLPAALKKVSIIFYLQSMCPIVVADPDPNMRPIYKFLVNAAEPVSAPIAILGLAVVTGVVLVLAGRLARGLEINYSVD